MVTRSSSSTAYRRASLTIIACMLVLSGLAVYYGSFRVDDWTNLERGRWALSAEGRVAVWTETNPFSLYRPIVDYWHGTMLHFFGLQPRPMLAALALLMVLSSLLLARVVRERGGSAGLAALTVAALWAQPNAYAWTTLWVSNATASLLAVATLAVFVQHHRAVRHAMQGTPTALTQASMLLFFIAGALCKEEIVLLPGGLAALEWARWQRLDARGRTAAIRGIALLCVAAVLYAAARVHFFPPPPQGNRYHLAPGPHTWTHLRFFALHLGALPGTAALLALLLFPAARRRETWMSPEGKNAIREALAGLAWAAISILLYLPIQGRPAYGYLYVPAFGIAYAVAQMLGMLARRGEGQKIRAPLIVALHASLATALVAWGLASVQWPSYGPLTRAAMATLDREMPSPPPGALFAFVDVAEGETGSGRTIFNLIFAQFSPAMLRLHYGREDLRATIVDRIENIPARAAIAFDTRGGKLTRIDMPRHSLELRPH